MDPDPDPANFVIDLQDVNKANYFKDKNFIKKYQNSKNQGYFYYFCLMIEGSGSVGQRYRYGS
jgi:hypothetical protein